MSYEKTDINLRSIAVAVVFFVVATALISAGVWVMFAHYRNLNQSRDVRRSQVQTPLPVPPEPRLQLNPNQDLRQYRANQQRILESYDWVSREQGRVRIPIGRAMELMVEQERSIK